MAVAKRHQVKQQLYIYVPRNLGSCAILRFTAQSACNFRIPRMRSAISRLCRTYTCTQMKDIAGMRIVPNREQYVNTGLPGLLRLRNWPCNAAILPGNPYTAFLS